MPRKYSIDKKRQWLKWGLPHGIDTIQKYLMEGKVIQANQMCEDVLKTHKKYFPFDWGEVYDTDNDKEVFGMVKPKSK